MCSRSSNSLHIDMWLLLWGSTLFRFIAVQSGEPTVFPLFQVSRARKICCQNGNVGIKSGLRA